MQGKIGRGENDDEVSHPLANLRHRRRHPVMPMPSPSPSALLRSLIHQRQRTKERRRDRDDGEADDEAVIANLEGGREGGCFRDK